VSHTGVGGLTLGGGMGRLQRKHGFTIDNLRAAEVVTADGRLVSASDDENADLFWALRGAGPNFGVVTAFEFNLHPFDGRMTVGSGVFPVSRIRDAWATYREWAAVAPDHLLITFGTWVAAVDEFPAPLGGNPVVRVAAFHSGDQASAEDELRTVIDAAEPAFTKIEPVSYLDLQGAFDVEMAWGHRVYTKGGFTDDLPDEALDALAEHVHSAVAGVTFGSWAQGGAINRVSDDAMAFTGHSAPFQMSTDSQWDDPADDEMRVAWARQAYAIVEPYSRTGRYVNDVTDTAPDLARWIYGEAKYERLRQVKRTWDPENTFRHNQNIKPDA
jgi:FAD/FMN-containing dehydrogenase